MSEVVSGGNALRIPKEVLSSRNAWKRNIFIAVCITVLIGVNFYAIYRLFIQDTIKFDPASPILVQSVTEIIFCMGAVFLSLGYMFVNYMLKVGFRYHKIFTPVALFVLIGNIVLIAGSVQNYGERVEDRKAWIEDRYGISAEDYTNQDNLVKITIHDDTYYGALLPTGETVLSVENNSEVTLVSYPDMKELEVIYPEGK